MLPLSKMLSLPATVLALCASHVLGATLAARDAQSTTMPAPIAFTPDEDWDGIDGQWSTFTVRIGTPQQFVRTFVSWSSYQTWAVLPEGCQAASDTEACEESRGGFFNNTESSTWDRIGIYDLWIKRNLGINANAIFGYDVVGIGGVGEEGPTLQNTTVGAMALEQFYLGIFGINPKPTNFTSFNDGSPSYMTQLKEQKYIPSVSFGYTAGAKYRYSGVYASLTLGGYDESIAGDPMEFIFAGDNERDTLPAIQSISTPSQTDSSPVGTELLPAPIYAYLDATVAEIWLPIEACQAFEAEFGLVYDNLTQLYLVNDTLHQTLLDRDASITFTLGAATSGGQTVTVELPYAAFDLTAKSPYQGLSNDTNYFPLRRAQNDTQYTIGRTFFQEAYITVDYESQRFNVSQRTWSENSTPHLIAIPPYTGNDRSYPGTSDNEGSSSSLGGGAIAGIVVGAVAIIALLAGLLIWHFRRRSKAAKAAAAAAEQEKLGGSDTGSQQGEKPSARDATRDTVIPKAELDATDRFGGTHYESDKNRMLHPGGVAASDSGYSGSVSGSGSPRTPNGTLNNFRDSAQYSPSSPSTGEGTYSSTGTGRGSSTFASGISPLGGGAFVTTAAEAGGRERPVFEMAGDMPVIREKDGHALSEKEALAHREKVYNGVNSETNLDEPPVARERPARVDAENVVPSGRAMDEDGVAERRDFVHHRQFSFEFDRGQNGSGSEEGSTGYGTGGSGTLTSGV